MGSLATNLAVVFGARIVVAQVKQSVVPYFQYHRRMEHQQGHGPGKSKLTRPEKELQLDEVSSICLISCV